MDPLQEIRDLDGSEDEDHIRAVFDKAEKALNAHRDTLIQKSAGPQEQGGQRTNRTTNDSPSPQRTKADVDLGTFASEYDGTPAEAAKAYQELPDGE